MKFTKVPADTFKNIQLNAGVLLSDFDPATATLTASDIIGATSGGVTFEATPSFVDFGDDIDNVPANTMELKKLETWKATMSGSFVTVSAALAKKLVAAGDIDATDTTKIVPRVDLLAKDFGDIWWVGDYSDQNGAADGGFVAIHLMNALSTGGFSIKSSDKGKGTFDFEFAGHYSLNNIDTVPFEIYIKQGGSPAAGGAGEPGVEPGAGE